jgi:hypothetical protein
MRAKVNTRCSHFSGLVIGFQYKGQLTTIRNNTESNFASAGITGISDSGGTFVSFHKSNKSKQQAMFTVEQIKASHSKVKSGADFPSYIEEIKVLGVTHYAITDYLKGPIF